MPIPSKDIRIQNLLERLVQFYLNCIDEEDRRGLTKSLSQHHYSFISPWDHDVLFSNGALEASFHLEHSSDVKMIQSIIQGLDLRDLFYGYPFYAQSDDILAPLFFTQVEVSMADSGEYVVRPFNPNEVYLNHHVFRRLKSDPEELLSIQEYFEGKEFGSFYARLAAVFDFLGLDLKELKKEKDGFPSASSPRETWYWRPILFRSERSSYTANLWRELNALKNYPRFPEDANQTSLSAILNPSAVLGSRDLHKGNLLEIRPLNMKQEEAVRSGLINTLTVITGPPGTGKSQVVVNLLANCAMQGKPVLFVSRNNKAVDVVRAWMTEVLGEEEDWIFRAGSKEKIEELKKRLVDQLMKLDQVRREKDTMMEQGAIVNINLIHWPSKSDPLALA